MRRRPSAWLHVGMAKVPYERDELPTGPRQATKGIEHCRRLAYAPALVAGLITLARIRHAEGDPSVRSPPSRRRRA